MQVRKFFLTGLFAALSLLSLAQNRETATLAGQVQSSQNERLIGTTVVLRELKKGTTTDGSGRYQIDGLKPGTYTITFSYLGYQTIQKTITLKAGERHQLNVTLTESNAHELESVSVIGRTEVKEASRLAYNVTAIDARALHNTTLDLNSVLDRVSGVRVRETGGVGSSFNFSLNGFTGRQVKFFIDGIPMDNFGSSFQLNNIPVNLAERIEVYKGVVPIWLGADALGGAVNIITNTNARNYLDVSYSYGSFNTHRTAINTGFTSQSGFTFQLNAFQNYSANNYWVNVDVVPDLNTGLSIPMRVRRFHDTYHNETLIAQVGVVNKKYADRLLFGLTLGQNKADIQTGNRMYDVFGQRRRQGNIIMPSIKYSKKDLFTKGLNLSFSGNFNLGQEQAIDTAYRQYNWLGDFIYKGSNPNIPGGELSRTLYKYRNNNGLTNATLSYQLNARHSLVLNHTYNTFNRKGEDMLNPDDEAIRQPRRTDKHVIGLGYRFDKNERWNTAFFAKEYIQKSKMHTVLDGNYYVQSTLISKQGYGLASTYFLQPKLQLKGSYEKSYRLPENDELFGDVINLASNPLLRPESSHNFNVGANYTVSLQKKHHLYVDANLIYRSAKDFIRPSLYNSFGRAIQQMVNLRDVTNSGVDGEIRYSFKRLFTAGVSLTYQNIRNNTKYENSTTEVSPVYKDRIPNMPYLFGNGNASFFLKNVGGVGNTLTLGYNLLYVHEYYLRWPSQGSATTKLTIPEQVAHDVNVVYSLANGKYNVALECRNLTDAVLYDNFSLQKPSRSFSVKLRYFLVQ
ncbi:TonB-dependent receptor [Siphonobacter sp. SORGH_AS_1065]|uniref:TonB-dependent receptor n=1 Tax=Siphonobacter sp. SORGH_AS_1065 TaxID=3041795 RepID=UPI002784A048|nr:TonB-dependent receptor [Siphonobacter sp. SORGH_AS_1065]MDQ1089188.1 outer membrane receptor protein involved in Fe transport [Siphonobacter sp. SORGH_AS_1065]